MSKKIKQTAWTLVMMFAFQRKSQDRGLKLILLPPHTQFNKENV